MKTKFGKEITHAYKIHMVEEETFGGGSKQGCARFGFGQFVWVWPTKTEYFSL